MKLIYEGKFSGRVEDLPRREHPEGAVKFEESDSPEQLAKTVGIWSIRVVAVAIAGLFLRAGLSGFSFVGAIMTALILFPHELLHAVCFRGEVHMYTNWRQGMLFVVGTEDMSRRRFVLMSLFPNIVFGLIPYVLFLIWPQLNVLGTMGAVALSMGVGDYYNVYNALTQVPKDALTYLSGFHSYWYVPK